MKTRVRSILIALVIFALGFLGGSFFGTVSMFRVLYFPLTASASSTLAVHVEALSRYRTGREESSIELIESIMDGAVDTLSRQSQIPWLIRPKVDPIALASAKAYRKVFPKKNMHPTVLAQYEQIADLGPDVSACSAALKDIIKMAKNDIQ